MIRNETTPTKCGLKCNSLLILVINGARKNGGSTIFVDNIIYLHSGCHGIRKHVFPPFYNVSHSSIFHIHIIVNESK